MATTVISQEIETVMWAKAPPSFARIKCKATGAQLAGLRYEKAVLEYLSSTYKQFIPLPWLMYKAVDDVSWKWCQPDGIIINFKIGHINVIECKVRHMASAFQKLDSLYLPLLRKLFPARLWTMSGIEVTRAYDCAVRLPVRVSVHSEVNEVLPETYGVVVWDKKKQK